MNLTSTSYSHLHFKPNNLLTSSRIQFPPIHHHLHDLRRRKRLKKHYRRCKSRNVVTSSLIPQFSSLITTDLIGPVLGFASVAAVFISRWKSEKNLEDFDVGKWKLFISPTTFDRFVVLRCPSLSLEGSETLEDVNERLLKEDMHCGRIQVRNAREDESEIEYQRVCVRTDDGGVIALDWPATLDLRQERGLDTTVVIVPGTAEGSMEKSVRSFVFECLKCGCFPIVMNPRGCAGSPLTTARLFTAADSDDICTAIKYVNNARPWSTLMAVGLGYGANMLTKYLAEAGDKTPLSAATCIDNPFDLQEATSSSPYHNVIDQRLTLGLIDILQSNKELFVGRAKGFDVEKGLLAKSVRDFEKAISMVSYGFNCLKDFYYESSTHGVVGSLKIPVLFIQTDGGTEPTFSIPHNLIAENPHTSLLICSSSQSSIISGDIAIISWCHRCTIEWLMAVELGLLKGRHPLLQDVDVSINPSNGLSRVVGGPSDKVERSNLFLELAKPNVLNGYHMDPTNNLLGEGNNAGSRQISRQHPRSDLEIKVEGSHQPSSDTVQQTNSPKQALEIGEDNAVDVNERGQVLQTAEMVMKMLDVTMPGTLAEEQKKKVLAAVGHGDTLMKALQDAVPEDVRGNLTTAVSSIFSSQGKNFKISLPQISHPQNVPSGVKSDTSEKAGAVSNEESVHKDPLVNSKKGDNQGDESENIQPATGVESKRHTSEKSQSSSESHQESSNGNNEVSEGSHSQNVNPNENGVVLGSKEEHKVAQDGGISHEDVEREKSIQSVNPNENGVVPGSNEEHKVAQDGGISHEDVEREKSIQSSEEGTSESTEQKTSSSTGMDESLSSQGSSAEATLQGNNNQEREEKVLQPTSNQNSSVSSDSNPPAFNVSQALDSLAGMDDSTQVAVKNVFGVIENMITHFEAENDNRNDPHNNNKVHGMDIKSPSEAPATTNEHDLETREDNADEPSSQPTMLRNPPDNQIEPHAKNTVVEDLSNDTNYSDAKKISNIPMGKELNEINEHRVGERLSTESSDLRDHSRSVAVYLGKKERGEIFSNDEFQRYPLSKLPTSKTVDKDTTNALLLDYIPEERQWKLLEHPRDTGGSKRGTVSEPPYMIFDADKQQQKIVSSEILRRMYEKGPIKDYGLEKMLLLAKTIILESLKIEVGRRFSAIEMKEMESDLAIEVEQVADAVSLAVQYGRDHNRSNIKDASERVGALPLDRIVEAITCAVHDTTCLKRVLPLGLIVGSCLATLRKVHILNTVDENVKSEEPLKLDEVKNAVLETDGQVCETEASHISDEKADETPSLAINTEKEKAPSNYFKNDNVMVGAVTAALGASTMFAYQQDKDPAKGIKTAETSSMAGNNTFTQGKANESLEEAVRDENQSNIVTSLAEKAMSVAGPVLPTNESGQVDQERVVTMLAELGQQGGMLRLVGKLALLWGGIRGAMSLTYKLIMFFRIAERPLYQRLLAFLCLALLLWSPVVIPLLPTLMQGWAMHSTSNFAELACVLGLYIAVMILVMVWGDRVRGYDNPLEQYGLDFASLSKIQNFVKAFIGGAMLVLSIQSIHALLGCVSLSWPSSLPYSFSMSAPWFKAYGKMLLLAGQCIATATAIALVEELLFRSWLPAEIASDFGYQRGIILSGLAFSLLQRSPQAIPGLWLLSLGLAGARQRSQGSLSVPIGLRTGIMTVSFILQKGGILTYHSNVPSWVTGTHPFQPFSGIVGLTFSLMLAVVLYPKPEPLHSR